MKKGSLLALLIGATMFLVGCGGGSPKEEDEGPIDPSKVTRFNVDSGAQKAGASEAATE